MKVFELTTGFIAAVVVALGVNHYVNNTPVEEEPVTKNEAIEISAKTLATEVSAEPYHWYKINAMGNVEEYLGEEFSTELESLTNGCNDQGEAICAVGYEDDPELDEGQPYEPTSIVWRVRDN